MQITLIRAQQQRYTSTSLRQHASWWNMSWILWQMIKLGRLVTHVCWNFSCGLKAYAVYQRDFLEYT